MKREGSEGKALNEILEDPASCGLDLRQDILMAVIEDGDFLEVVAAMFDKGKFEQTLSKFIAEKRFREKDSFTYVEIENDKVVLAWDKNKAILISHTGKGRNSEDALSIAKMVMSLKKGESVVMNKNFSEFWDNRGDAGYYFEMSSIMGLPEYRDVKREIPSKYLDGMDEMGFFSTLTFENGKANMHSQYVNVNNEYIKSVMSQKFNKDLLSYMPKNPLAAATISFNTSAVKDIIEDIDSYTFSEKISRNNAQYTYGDFFDCFNGSFAAAICELKKDDRNKYMPVYAIAADLSDSRTLEKMLGNEGLQKTNGYYKVDDDVYVAVYDNSLVITNDKYYLEGDKKDGFNGLPGFANGNLYAFLDFDIDNYPKEIKNSLKISDSRRLLEALAGTLVFKMNENYSADITLNMNTSENILSYLFGLVDDYEPKINDIAEDIEDVVNPRPNYGYDYDYNYYNNRYSDNNDYSRELEEIYEELMREGVIDDNDVDW